MCLTEQPFRSPPPLFDSTSSISRVSWACCGQVTFGFWQAKCEKRSFPLLSSWPLRRSQDRQALSAKGYAQAKRLSPVVPLFFTSWRYCRLLELVQQRPLNRLVLRVLRNTASCGPRKEADVPAVFIAFILRAFGVRWVDSAKTTGSLVECEIETEVVVVRSTRGPTMYLTLQESNTAFVPSYLAPGTYPYSICLATLMNAKPRRQFWCRQVQCATRPPTKPTDPFPGGRSSPSFCLPNGFLAALRCTGSGSHPFTFEQFGSRCRIAYRASSIQPIDIYSAHRTHTHTHPAIKRIGTASTTPSDCYPVCTLKHGSNVPVPSPPTPTPVFTQMGGSLDLGSSTHADGTPTGRIVTWMSPSLSLSPGVPSGAVLISLPPLLLVPAIGTGYLLPSNRAKLQQERHEPPKHRQPVSQTMQSHHLSIAIPPRRDGTRTATSTMRRCRLQTLQLCLASLQTTSQTSQFAASSPSQRKAGQRLGRLGNLGGLGCRYQAPSACILRHGDRAPYAMLCIPSLTLD